MGLDQVPTSQKVEVKMKAHKEPSLLGSPRVIALPASPSVSHHLEGCTQPFQLWGHMAAQHPGWQGPGLPLNSVFVLDWRRGWAVSKLLKLRQKEETCVCPTWLRGPWVKTVPGFGRLLGTVEMTATLSRYSCLENPWREDLVS